MTIREDKIIPVLDQFFEQRIFGEQRADLLAPSGGSSGSNDDVTALTAALADDIADLQRRQYNLLAELEQFEPSGGHDFDQAWRSGVQARFQTTVAALKAQNAQRAKLSQQRRKPAKINPVLLEVVPQAIVAVSRLPQKQQRRLFDAFHLELRYNHLTSDLDIQVTITGRTADALGATVQGIIAGSTDEEFAADPPNARSRLHLSPKAPIGPGHDRLIIKERIVLRPGR